MVIGEAVGPYRVLAKLGEGGMGEVYRARDTKLGRDVALKILPHAVAADPDRLMRFEREARTLASLNHPHVAQIFGFEQASGASALVMELVEGEDLSARIARGPIPLDDALPMARQIAEALEFAHEQGIIHRDLKPANIKVRPDGTVKVLDFGLAKALDQVSGIRGQVSGDYTDSPANSPTITSPAMTQMGVILGTAAYMSPEQAKGKPADKRSDIWAFGCVLYEMLTSRRAFPGDEVSETLAAVIKSEPAWAALPADTPRAVVALLRRCLTKDVQKRLPHIGLARLEIDELSTLDAADSVRERGAAEPVGKRRRIATAATLIAVGLAAGLLLATAAAPFLSPSAPASSPTRLTATLDPSISLSASAATTMGSIVVLSPDGRTVVFVGQGKAGDVPQLYVRRLAHNGATPLTGTGGARAPFFSPDGQWIGFFSDGKLKKVAVAGGASVAIADAPDHRGGTWLEDGRIIFAALPLAGLSVVSSSGGSVAALTQLEQGEVTHRWPHALPGGKAVLYEANNTRAGHDAGTIFVQPLDGSPRRLVHRGGYAPGYLRSGHVVFVQQGTLFAQPFHGLRLEALGPPVPAIEGLAANPVSGWAHFTASNRGDLVYLPGGVSDSTATLDLVNRAGTVTPLYTRRLNWAAASFSPDGRSLALTVLEGSGPAVWVLDTAREALSRLTNGARPVWTPDGKRITFGLTVGSSTNIYWTPADGSGEPQRLTTTTKNQVTGAWHPSGKYFAFREAEGTGPGDIMILSMEGSDASGWKPGNVTPFATGALAENDPAFSPDGRWIVYSSVESGQDEVYVRPFPGPGPKVQVSTGGGSYPAWSRTSRELLYASPGRLTYAAFARSIMAVSYTVVDGALRPERPRAWTSVRAFGRFFEGPMFALHPDGERVALTPLPDDAMANSTEEVVFVFNFVEELRRLTSADAGK